MASLRSEVKRFRRACRRYGVPKRIVRLRIKQLEARLDKRHWRAALRGLRRAAKSGVLAKSEGA